MLLKKHIAADFVAYLNYFFIGFTVILLSAVSVFAQKGNGVISGIIYENEYKTLPFATLQLCNLKIPEKCKISAADKNGYFQFDLLEADYYFIKITGAGFGNKKIDSIYIREEKMKIDLHEIILSNKTTVEDEIIVYAERPLIENKDGKIIFNVGETAAANSNNVNELLQKTPFGNH